jgi:predicted cupin superfamily sugar epimerase
MSGADAEDLRRRLGLEPHPTCGFVAMTYVSPDRIAPGGVREPFAAGRPLGSALQFMVTPEAPVHLHRIANDQLYIFQLGDPLDVLALRPDGTHERVVVGPDVAAGHRLVLPLPGGTFHTARLVEGGAWFLGCSTEWPGVEPADVEVGDRERLAAVFPSAAADLDELLGPA